MGSTNEWEGGILKFSSVYRQPKSKMSGHVFSVLGDSNVQRHMNPMNCRDRPMMSSCQVLPCGKVALLAEALRAVKAESTVVLVACLTNFLTSSADAGSSIIFRIEPVLRESLATLNEAALVRPDLTFVVSPPMYRLTPLWYRDHMPVVLTTFADVFKARLSNVHLAKSFPTPDFDGDGVHLTPYSGLAYVLHLFDVANELLSSLSLTPEESRFVQTESTRGLEDRMMAIEQDHRRLNSSVELKSAIDAELFDFQQNIRFEDCFTISGLARLPSGLAPKEWQKRARIDVQAVLTILMGREYPIVVVLNSTSKRKDAPATYHVQLTSVADSKEIRKKFGLFWLGGLDKRPEALTHISLQIRVTPATSVRIGILKVFGRRYTSSNPGSSFQVINYDPRPILKIYPAKDQRAQTYNFIEAIQSLPTNFTQDELDFIIRKVSPKLYGQLRPLFIVISDDMIRRSGFGTKDKDKAPKGSKDKSSKDKSKSSGGAKGPPKPGSSSGSSSGSPILSDPRTAHKRGATSPAEGGPAKSSK